MVYLRDYLRGLMMNRMSKRPRFDDFYKGEWDYHSSAGVGLSFSGVPTDYISFLDILMGASCNPISSRRILNILERNETKYVTVMDSLNFNEIGHKLKEIGVTMKITPPFEYANETDIDDNSKIDMAVLAIVADKEYKITLEEKFTATFTERLLETQRSLEDKPHNFGPYDNNYKRTH